MLVHVNSGIKDWSDLRNKRIVTTKGTAMSDVINKRSNIAGIDVIAYPTAV